MEDEETNSEEAENDAGETEISAQFASLELTVQTQGKEDCKELFDETWRMLMEDAEEMSEAARERLGGTDF